MPDHWLGRAARGAARVGWAARVRRPGASGPVLYSLPTSLVGRRHGAPPVPPAVADRYALELQALAASLAVPAGDDKPALLALDQEAGELLLGFERELEPRLASGGGDLAHLAGWAAKLAGATCRLAGLLHLAGHLRDGWARPISADTLTSGIRWPTTSSSTPARCSTSWAPTPAQTTPAGSWTGSPALTRPSSPAAMPTRRPRGDGSRRPPTSSQRCPCSSTGICAASTPTLPGPPRPRPTRLPAVPGQPSATRHRNTRNDKNHRGSCFCGFCRFCARGDSPGADDEGHILCHVIQRERPQPFPAMPGVAPGRHQPPAPSLWATTARPAERRPPI